MTRRASCRCGQLTATCEGEPVRVSVCHCLACQQRSGSAFSAQARWPKEKVAIEGRSKAWTHTADSGNSITYAFCPDCGSTVYYTGGNFPDLVAVPVRAFADPQFPRRNSRSGKSANTNGLRFVGITSSIWTGGY